MEPTNCFFPVPTDCTEEQPNMGPRTRLWKLVIERIELKQKDPSFYVRSLPPESDDFKRWSQIRRILVWTTRISGHGLALEIAALDTLALISVSWRVEKNDNLREVLARAARSIPQAVLHAGSSSQDYDWYESWIIQPRVPSLPASAPRSKQQYLDASELDSELAIAYTFHAFLTSVLHLLTSVFQYLLGYVDRGGSQTYSSGAFDFRASFVSLVLFQGAYVWIKFRQAARPSCRKRKAPAVEHEVVDIETGKFKGVYARRQKSSGAIKYEPRFTPPGQARLPLGEYHTVAEAQIVRHVAGYYYDKDGDCVELEDGRYKLRIPPMRGEEQGLTGDEKREWVRCTAKQVGKQMYADFRREKGKQLDMAPEADSRRAEFSDPSSSALALPCPSLPLLTTTVAEPALASTTPSCASLPLPAFHGATVGDGCDVSLSRFEIEDMLAELSCDPGLSNLPDQQSNVVPYQMHYQGFAQLLGDPSLPEVGNVTVGIEHESELESNIFQEGSDFADAGKKHIDGRIFLPRSDPDLEQLLLCQKKCLEENARKFVDLDHELIVSQIQNSRLQQEKEVLRTEKEQVSIENEQLRTENKQLRTENESWKSKLEQVAKISSCDLDCNRNGHSTKGLNGFGS